MVGWMSRPHLSPQAQLLQAAWQGDPTSLRRLLTQTGRVDVNVPNSQGVTAAMLVVRDIDLFEGLTMWLPWEHRPVEVIKELLGSSADLRVRDHRGCSVLHYAENICSPQREEIVWILTEALGHTDKQQTSFQSIMETLKDSGGANQDVKKGSSKGLCLPSLSNNIRHWGQMDTALSSGLLNTRTLCQPVPPIQRQRTRSVVDASPPSHGLLSVVESSPLSQSAPSIMEPLMFSNSMMQARTHIQNRLGSQNILHEQKDLLPVLRSQTPKLLAPLDGRPKDSKALPVLQQHIPLKPITPSPHCSRTQLRRDRLSWDSPSNGPPIREAGGDESGSSSNNNQSSVSLENPDDERQFQKTAHKDRTLRFFGDGFWQHSKDVISPEEDFSGEKMQHLKAQSKNNLVPLVNRSIHTEERDHHLHKEKPKNPQCEANYVNHPKESAKTESSDDFNYAQKGDILISKNNQTHITSAFREDKRNEDCMTKSKTEMSHPVIFDVNNLLDDGTECSENDKNKQFIEETESARNKSCDQTSAMDAMLKTGTAEGKSRIFTVNPKNKKTFKALKPVRNRERRTSMTGQLRTNNQSKQSVNVLGHKNQNTISVNKSKIKQKYPEISTDVKEKIRKSPDTTVTLAKDKLKMKSVSDAGSNFDTPTPCKDSELSQSNITHQHATVRELKSAQQSRKPGLGGKNTRSKSAGDLITYKDLFQQIPSNAEGPAIYEMFAGPIFENLRVSSSCAATRKTKQGYKVKPRPLKTIQKLKRSSGESTTALAKSKTKPVPPRVKPHSGVGTRRAICETEIRAKLEAVGVSDVSLKKVQDESEDHALSTIEEAASRYDSDTLKPEEESLTTLTSSIYLVDYTFMQNHKMTFNTSTQTSTQQVSEASLLPSSQQAKTSSSSSRHTIMSPVYKRFLDEVGDGPLTDDLLQCLAEELISLDERDASTGFEDPEQKKKEFNREEKLEFMSLPHKSPEVAPIESEAVPGDELGVVDTITWTKGEVLGKGAYGTVYCGLTSQGQLIAVKQVHLDSSDSDTANKEYSRLQGEVELLKTLRHINIVGFLGTSLYQHVVSIFMEYIPGGSIASILHRFGPLPERVLALYTHQILEGVAYLHLNRVIHRDLKGNNVMLMPTGVIKLIDFGCARRLSCLNHTACNSGELLKSVHGTPYWIAPEVINESGYGRKSDIWSVGCTVFEMATGKPPLSHMAKMAALFYIGTRRGSMPMLPDGFSESAKDFVRICLTSDQKLRPSADQLLQHSFVHKKETNIKACEMHRQKCAHQMGLWKF
ncbi:mitogen-activated protein kinase kinase kinase 19 isoform X1 [Kryptolebias marmoratus]|nr:mitogen-activated protein kinase kinase kinase 19 isoform X1 [Kryptolebias marmoratus]